MKIAGDGDCLSLELIFMAEFPRGRSKSTDIVIFWEQLWKSKGKTRGWHDLRELDILYGTCEKLP